MNGKVALRCFSRREDELYVPRSLQFYGQWTRALGNLCGNEDEQHVQSGTKHPPSTRLFVFLLKISIAFFV